MTHLSKCNPNGVNPMEELFSADALLVDLIQAVDQCGREGLEKPANHEFRDHQDGAQIEHHRGYDDIPVKARISSIRHCSVV